MNSTTPSNASTEQSARPTEIPFAAVASLSLQDWFAGQVAAGMLSAQADPEIDTLPNPEDVATYAYRVAGAMVAKRKALAEAAKIPAPVEG